MAAQDAELKLKVSLDLAFFRQQLSGLGAAAAGTPLKLQVQLDRRSVQNELNALGRNISQRTYRLEVATNLAAEIKNAGTLAKALRGLDNAVQKNKGIANRAAAGQGAGTVDASSFSAMLNRATKPALEALYQGMAKAKIPMADVGRGTIKELQASIMSGVPAITRDIAQGLANGLDPKLKENGREGAKFFIDAFKSAAGIASPSEIFKQLGEFSADGLEIGFLNGLKEFKGKAIAEIKKIVALMKLELASVGDIDMAARGGPRINRVFARGSGGYTAPIGPLPHGSVEPWAMGPQGYEPRMVSSVRGMPGGFAAWSRAMTNNPPQPSQARSTLQFGGGGGFPSDGPYGGKQGPATFIGAGSSMEKFKTGMDVASASMKNFRASQIPLIGSLKEIASEFGFALKQVLLFGTAYKGLAFIQSLPGQVLNAAKSQQQFNNALQTATQDTGTFAKELLYVDNVQRAFGLNLETTRSGFVRLYASMAPTGFDSGSIEKLFTGISAATAALQLTPDKAERVIYAFGQMASKGQIMSEELKGQLGDVLPGALAIFAKSAGMSVKEFSKAMEDGEFVGSRFREVFAKVSDELMNRFGTGAQAAGRSLQGLLNTVQGDFQRTLESFAPLANAAAQAILLPLSGALKQLSMSAQIAMGEQTRVQKQLISAQKDLGDLKMGGAKPEQIQAATQNVAALQARLEGLNEAAKDPAIAKQAKDIENFVSQVSAAARNITNFAGAIGNVLGPILTFFGTNLNSVIGNLTLLIIGFNGAKIAAMAAMAVMATMDTLNGISRGAAVGVNILAGAFRLLGVAATGAQIATIGFGTAVKVLLASTGVGLLVVALGSIAAAFLDVGNKASRAAERTKTAMSAMQDAIRSGNVEIARAQLADTQRLRNEVEDAVRLIDKLRQKGRKTGRGGLDVYARASLAERMQLEQAGYDVQLQGRGEVRITSLESQTAGLRAELANLEQRQKAGVALAEKRKQDIGLDQPTPTKPGAGTEQDDNTVKEKRKYVSQLSELLRQELDNKLLAIDQNALLNDRMREIQKAAATYDAEMLIAEAEYNEKISAEKTKNIANLTQYLKESKRLYDLEKAQIQSRYEGVVTKPLRDMLNADIADQEKLKASIKSLGEGKDELTRVEERQLQIKNALSGLDEESIKQLKPLIDRILKEAAAVDRLTEAQKAANKAKEERQRLDEGIKNTISNLKEEIALLRAASEEERKRLKIRQENKGISKEKEDEIYRLEKVRDNIKATRELIDNFVDDTSRDYKGFLKAVISGEDAADALQQFQEGLADRVLTIFLDFSMKPVEDFFKDVMGGEIIEKLFPRDKLKEGELPKATSTDPVKAANDNTNATNANTNAINDLTNKLTTQASQATAPGGGASGYFNTNILSSGLQSAMQGMNTGVGFGAGGSFAGSAAFSQELSSISTGLQNATPSLTGFSQAVNGFSNTAVDTAVQTAEAAKTAQQSGAEFAQGLGKAVQGIGIAVSSVMTIMAGIQQMNKGGTKNTLAGIGSILLGLGSGLGGFLKLGKAANGAVWKGGFQAFANGGTVSGPTLGLIGEGRYNEAIVPLPDGKSIPVALQGGSRSRDLISDRSERSAAPVLNMSFQTTSINGIEYVSKDQLEQAMAQTRRLAAKEGATKGASMAIDKLQQSPSVRRRVGM